MEWLRNICKQREDELIALRRALHRVPEIGLRLPRTKAIVCAKLDQLGIPYRENEGDDGVIAEICGAKPGKTIAFRADMDALHIQEVDRPYASEIPGQMHGCGHDAHTAMLLMAAAILNEHKDRLCGTVRLLFQTAEEKGIGAHQMIAEGALDGVDAICAIHVGALAGEEYNSGDLIVLPGPVTAGKNRVTVTVHGKGTHSAFPEMGIDPIGVAARILLAAEELSDKKKGVVLSFGNVEAGIDHNTIPDRAVLRGGLRVQDEQLREELGRQVTQIAEQLAADVGATCEVEIKKGSVTVMNDPQLSALVAQAVERVCPGRVITQPGMPLMGSDDFCHYAVRVPGVYFFLHTNNRPKGIEAFNHNPGFDVDESVLWEGVAAYVATARCYLANISK